LNHDPSDARANDELDPRMLDAWSWIARARAAAARSVAPDRPRTSPSSARTEAPPGEHGTPSD
jgi:hypothetical protein